LPDVASASAFRLSRRARARLRFRCVQLRDQALRLKRAEISGHIHDLEKRIARQRVNLANLDATIKLFSPGVHFLWQLCHNTAKTPLQAMLNAASARLTRPVLARGLDPAFGFLHNGRKPGRLSLVWDCVEPLRPELVRVMF
jgi:hypothetical protein